MTFVRGQGMLPAATDSSAADSLKKQNSNPLDKSGISALTLAARTEASDTIPDYFFHIMDDFGLNPATQSLLLELNSIDERMILSVISETDTQTDYLRANAYAIIVFIRMMNQRSDLWRDFFHDLDIQLRDPNIFRVNFKDDQAWKSYTLNELLRSTAFSELMLIMGNLGIAESKDGRQLLEGWPDNLRWKYREYTFEYIPEDDIPRNIRFYGIEEKDTSTTEEESTNGGDFIRLRPARQILPVTPGDTLEKPLRIPELP